MSRKAGLPHALRELTSPAILLAVAAVGLLVITGWHLHARPLIQIIPGAIAMQYNTALCFAVLGASAFALITHRSDRLLPVVGGGFVALMGALVIFQYATGISLGIDTALFYPWERSYSADPGRMALTSALSFASAGGALALLALRPRALAPFAIAHTLPLSLGLTSALGYLLGISYVLPFRLGSQMAVHTALSFLAYGGVMLWHAFRLAPRTEEGLPKWSPAIAIVALPVLFVGISLSSQSRNSFTWSTPLFVGLLGAGLFGLVAYKLTRSRLAVKGLLLISVPLVFVLAFVVLVTRAKRQNEAAQGWYLHSKEVIAQAESLSRSLLDAESSVRGYVIAGDPAFAAAYQRSAEELPKAINQLRTLVRDNPAQATHALRLGEMAKARLAALQETEGLMRAGAQAQAAELVKSGEGLRLMEEFRREMAGFLMEEHRLDMARQRTIEDTWQQLNWLLVAGASLDILLALLLAVLFTRGISTRISTLTDNAQALAAGKELAHPLQGTDEIARLDHVFHKMARALAEAARKERAIVENSLDVICTVNEAGQFVNVSPASEQVWGYRPAELTGRRYIELVAAEDVERTNRAARDIMDGAAVTDFENRYQRKDGAIVHIMWSAFWSADEKLMYCVARDITERKRAEQLAEQQKLELEKMAADLTTANKELESFTYSVSHDLRAPLRAVDGFSRILLEDYADKLDDEGRRVLDVIRSNTQNMGQLIDDLLAFSRLGRKQIEPVMIDMSELAQDVFAQLEASAGERAPQLKLKPLPTAQGDRALIRQVFVNLLSNAVKYSRREAASVIEVGGSSENGENIYYIKDNGVGFDMKYVNKLFGVFQRLHSHEEFEGTGVGLAIVQRVVQRHGGRVWAEGKTGEGATFYFTLPRREDATDARPNDDE